VPRPIQAHNNLDEATASLFAIQQRAST